MSLPSPTWLAVVLLLVFIQLSTSLLVFAGEFIHSDQVLISPFRVCLTHNEDQRAFGTWRDAKSNQECWFEDSSLATAVMLCLYIPLVLVAFGSLAAGLAAFAEDPAAMRLSLLCQGSSGLLLSLGVVGFVSLHRDLLSWSGLSCWFYACLGAQVELVVTTALTERSVKRSDKAVEMMTA